MFTLAIRLITDTEIRIGRLKDREKQKYDIGSVNMWSKAKQDEWEKLLQSRHIVLNGADDVEEKWVVAPEGMSFTKEEIKEQIHFQEQYFDSEIVM